MTLRYTVAALIAGVLCLLAAMALAQAPERVPHVGDDGQRSYRNYLNQGFHRVFAISEGGGYGSGWGYSSIDQATKIATENCQKRDARGSCKPYSINGYVVWDKDASAIPRYADAPKLGRFIPSDYVPVRGPQTAPGVIVWSHGYFRGIDATQGQPHGYVSRFLAAGWDVYRYNREWVNELYADIQGMIESVAAAKAAGYKKVVLAGQSQGAWISMEALAKGIQADGVIATAMARHGAPPSSAARSDFRQLMRDIRSRGATSIPVVLTLFDRDDYDPGGRFVDVKDILADSAVPLYFIGHPPDLPGHGAGSNSKFNERFGPCIFRFIASSPPAPGDCK
jgi:predicted esterase